MVDSICCSLLSVPSRLDSLVPVPSDIELVRTKLHESIASIRSLIGSAIVRSNGTHGLLHGFL